MGMHVNAYLAYGVPFTEWGEVSRLPWESDEESFSDRFEDWLIELSGLTNPSANRGEVDWKTWHDVPENEAAMTEYHQKVRELVAQCPIKPVYYDSFDGEKVLILAVNSSVTEGNWEKPREAIVTVDDEAVEAAKKFCDEHGISFDEPKWLIVAQANN
jgi:hypothetical protein